MKNSSLNEAVDIITDAIMNTEKLDKIDKLELLINIQHFLEPKIYRENVKFLEKRRIHDKNKQRTI